MPHLRTDLVDVYVFRREPGVQFLQLRRAEPPLQGTWQPVMGQMEAGETAQQCAWRELNEELGLTAVLGAWALQGVHPFFLAATDTVMLSPRFCVEVAADWTPVLNGEHTDHRWVAAASVDESFLWPGQRAACAEVLDTIMTGRPAAEHLRIDRGTL
jgi:ADP-ribose pyrophosphatase YjhB (NUDIX family)